VQSQRKVSMEHSLTRSMIFQLELNGIFNEKTLRLLKYLTSEKTREKERARDNSSEGILAHCLRWSELPGFFVFEMRREKKSRVNLRPLFTHSIVIKYIILLRLVPVCFSIIFLLPSAIVVVVKASLLIG
jgi:hypothetical protein